MSTAAPPSPFNLRMVVIMLAAGLLTAAAFVVLLAYAPDLRNGHDGGVHPLSVAGTGYRGIVELLDDAGVPTVMVRDEDGIASASLLIVTLSPAVDTTALKDLARLRKGKPTLYVLPKWVVIPLVGHAGWVQRIGVDETSPQELLSALAPLQIAKHRNSPRPKRARSRLGHLPSARSRNGWSDRR